MEAEGGIPLLSSLEYIVPRLFSLKIWLSLAKNPFKGYDES